MNKIFLIIISLFMGGLCVAKPHYSKSHFKNINSRYYFVAASRHLSRMRLSIRLKEENPLSYSVIKVKATAYTPHHEMGGSSKTATGATVKEGIIAVDPRVIPLGTHLYIPGYGYGVALDTGGMIKGKHIDLGFESQSEVGHWGRKYIYIRVYKIVLKMDPFKIDLKKIIKI